MKSIQEAAKLSPNFKIFIHHVYEYQKGVRDLVLHTMNSDEENMVKDVLKRKKIDYFIQKVTEKKINIFFGDRRCVNVIKSFENHSLSKLTDEQDFMLGIMLGYDRMLQYERYLKKIGATNPSVPFQLNDEVTKKKLYVV